MIVSDTRTADTHALSRKKRLIVTRSPSSSSLSAGVSLCGCAHRACTPRRPGPGAPAGPGMRIERRAACGVA